MFLTSFFDQILETGSFIEVEFRDKRCLSEFFGAFKQAITVTKQGGCNLKSNCRVLTRGQGQSIKDLHRDCLKPSVLRDILRSSNYLCMGFTFLMDTNTSK